MRSRWVLGGGDVVGTAAGCPLRAAGAPWRLLAADCVGAPWAVCVHSLDLRKQLN